MLPGFAVVLIAELEEGFFGGGFFKKGIEERLIDGGPERFDPGKVTRFFLLVLSQGFGVAPSMVGAFETVLLDAIEERHHGKVIGLGDGVSFVIVAF